MDDVADPITTTMIDPNGKSLEFHLSVENAEDFIINLLSECAKRDPNKDKQLADRQPSIAVQYPEFMLNTTDMNEVVLALSANGWKPFSFTLSQDAVEKLRDGLNTMLTRLAVREVITKQ